MKRWQDWVTFVLGLWLVVSPWALGHLNDVPTALWNAFVLGLAIAISSATAMRVPTIWEEWINMAFGVWLIFSPWVLGFAALRIATLNAVIVGLIVIALGLWAMMRDPTFREWREHHHAT
jgi:SPW repeat